MTSPTFGTEENEFLLEIFLGLAVGGVVAGRCRMHATHGNTHLSGLHARRERSLGRRHHHQIGARLSSVHGWCCRAARKVAVVCGHELSGQASATRHAKALRLAMATRLCLQLLLIAIGRCRRRRRRRRWWWWRPCWSDRTVRLVETCSTSAAASDIGSSASIDVLVVVLLLLLLWLRWLMAQVALQLGLDFAEQIRFELVRQFVRLLAGLGNGVAFALARVEVAIGVVGGGDVDRDRRRRRADVGGGGGGGQMRHGRGCRRQRQVEH